MGSSSSSLIGKTHDQAFNETADTRMIMDELLNYMIKQLSVRDLLHMSKDSECKKYVLFKANSIYQHFYELRIFPTTDAKGLLTFRRVEDLVNPKGEQEKERQSLCLIVAYFYTRIFQIYGALALTLIDDVNIMTSSGLMSTVRKENDMRWQTPGYYEQSPYYGKGGAITLLSADNPISDKIPLKNFRWIRSFLTSTDQATNTHVSIGYKTRYKGTDDDEGIVHIKIDDKLRSSPKGDPISDTNPSIKIYQDATCFIQIPKVDKYIRLNVYTLYSGERTTFAIRGLTFTNNAREEVTVRRFDKIFSVDNIIKSSNNSDVSNFMAELFSKIINYVKSVMNKSKENILYNDTHEPDTTENSTNEHEFRGTRAYQSDRSFYSERGYQSDSNSRRYYNNRSTIMRKSEDGITSHLKVEKMIDNLTTRRPLGHCIARALQLLKTEPLANETGISQICSLAFSEKSSDRIGLPKRDKPLSDHPGLFALANLFYDTISIGSPHLTIGKDKVDTNKSSTFEDYVAFMKTLSKQYISDELTPQEMEKKGLSGITNNRDGNKEFCASANEIPLSSKTTENVYKIVKEMFHMQVKHSAKCYDIISMLFTITINPTTKKPTMFKLNENLIRKGFPELERINREARKILVEYYTKCENKYTEGMGLIWIEKDDKEKEAKQAEDAKLKTGLAQARVNLDSTTKAVKATLPQPSAPNPVPNPVTNPVIVQAQQRKETLKAETIKARQNDEGKKKIDKFTMRPVGRRSMPRNQRKTLKVNPTQLGR